MNSQTEMEIEIIRRSISVLTKRLDQARTNNEYERLENLIFNERERLKQIQSTNPENLL